METKHIQKIEETDDAITVTFGKAKPEEEKAKVKADETPEVKEEPKVEEAPKEEPKEEPKPEDKTFENEVANKELKSKKFYRTATIEKKYYEDDEEDRSIDLSFSSETPYERSFGMEIIDHDKMDLTFLDSGNAPFLADHDPTKVIGIVEKVNVANARGRAKVRFGKNELAQSIFQDIKDGIRPNISFGYEVLSMEKVKTKGEDEDKPSYKVATLPLEISSVSIPADQTVGVNRSKEIKNNEDNINKQSNIKVIMEKENNTVIAPTVDTAKTIENARKSEQDRVREIYAVAVKHNQKSLADESIKNGLSVAEFKGVILEKIGNQPIATRSDEVGLSKKEARNYSLARGVKAMTTGNWSGAELEKEASDEIAKRSGKSARGIFIPSDANFFKRDLTQGTATAGGNLVATDMLVGSYVEALRNKSMVRQAGATVLSGLVGECVIPAQNATTTAYWVAENAAATEGAPTYRQIAMSPKTVSAYVDVSRHLMHQSSLAIESILRKDLIDGLASAVDLGALAGSGSSNQPTGVLNQSGIGSVAIGTNGGAGTWAKVVDTWKEVAKDNADVGALSWFTSPTQVARFMQTAKVSSTDSQMIMNTQDNLMGYNVNVTNQMPDTLTKGTSSGDCSALLFGNFNDLIIGEWGNLDVAVDPYSLSTIGATRITSFYDVDIAVRHAESFSAIQDLNA
jgi:HK97 family phage major capsid protein